MKRYNFERKGCAMGIAVHASSMDEAIERARALNLREATRSEITARIRENLIFVGHAPCVTSCAICGIK